jgi:hypothetical protein
VRDSYGAILKDTEWQFLRSGDTSRPPFYKEFIDNLKKWSNWFGVVSTDEDMKYEEELKAVQDWSRDSFY